MPSALRVSELLDESSWSMDDPASCRIEARFAHHAIRQDVGFEQDQFRKTEGRFSATLLTKILKSPTCARSFRSKLDQMLQTKRDTHDFAARLQGIIDAYNAGSSSADNYFEELMKFAKDMKAESERHIREGLTEDELELFDLLKKEKMTEEETQKVRLAAQSLLHRLRDESPKVLVQDWFKDAQSKLKVRSAVETVLHATLPDSYDRFIFTEKCNNVFDSLLNYASQGVKWAA